MRDLRVSLGGSKPIHMIGCSNGAALAVSCALDARTDATLPRRAAWQLIESEVDPYKYQSFGFHAAGETQRLTNRPTRRIAAIASKGPVRGVPPFPPDDPLYGYAAPASSRHVQLGRIGSFMAGTP